MHTQSTQVKIKILTIRTNEGITCFFFLLDLVFFRIDGRERKHTFGLLDIIYPSHFVIPDC